VDELKKRGKNKKLHVTSNETFEEEVNSRGAEKPCNFTLPGKGRGKKKRKKLKEPKRVELTQREIKTAAVAKKWVRRGEA